MKHVLFALLLFFVVTYVQAQTGLGYGIKAGLNYGANGDVTDSSGEVIEHPDRNVGYHIGVFGKIGNTLYFRPELVYTNTKTTYDNDDFKIQKLDAPLLVGLRVIGPVSVFAGPSLQYILDTDFEGITLGDVQEDFTVGANFGVGVNLGRLGLDIRYERGFTDNEVRFINTNISNLDTRRVDTRPDQVILSLSLAL